MTYDLSRHLHARPDGYGGVTLTMRRKFRDYMGTFLPGTENSGSPSGRESKSRTPYSREVDNGILSGLVRATTAGINPGNTVAQQGQQDEYPPQIVKDANGNTSTRQTIFTFGPMARGQSYAFQEMDNGLIAVCLTSPASDYPGAGGTPTAGTSDRRSQYLTGTLRGEARKLANMNSANKRYYGR